jgi:hypothetical protein
MKVDLRRRGRLLEGVFKVGSVPLRPSLEGLEAATGRFVSAMQRGDEVHCSFESLPNLPLDAVRQLDRVVAEAHRLRCTLRLAGLPSDLGARYADFIPPAQELREKLRRCGTSSRRPRSEMGV